MHIRHENALGAKSVAAIEELINNWISNVRWFISDRKNPQVRIIQSYPLSANDTSSTTLLVVHSGTEEYFIPITLNIADEEFLASFSEISDAIIGQLTLDTQNLFVFDATEHPDGQLALLQACLGELAIPSFYHTTLREPLSSLPSFKKIHKIRSEQSNTSIIYEFSHPDSAGSSGIILKLLRISQPGVNPDIQLPVALDNAGTGAVPHQYGYAKVEINAENTVSTSDILVAQEFIADAKDAWQIFQDELATGTQTPLDPKAILNLGVITAQIHHTLATAFPTSQITLAEKTEIYTNWEKQADQAIAYAPKLAENREKISEIFAAAFAEDWPEAQRIHGDYHLGQVLYTTHQNWVALDFEGEPLKSLAERSKPSLALRDIAGMIRSFSYAAGAAEISGKPSTFTIPWANTASELFMKGYGTLTSSETVLLKALLLDKALYEVIYEARYRPRWLKIPIRAIAEIIS